MIWRWIFLSFLTTKPIKKLCLSISIIREITRRKTTYNEYPAMQTNKLTKNEIIQKLVSCLSTEKEIKK